MNNKETPQPKDGSTGASVEVWVTDGKGRRMTHQLVNLDPEAGSDDLVWRIAYSMFRQYCMDVIVQDPVTGEFRDAIDVLKDEKDSQNRRRGG